MITNRLEFHHINDQIELVRLAAIAGCPMIQIREKDLSDDELIEFASQCIEVARPYDTKIIINGKPELALDIQADGVHMPASAPRIKPIKNFIVGKSAHSLEEAVTAVEQKADYIICGPVYDTPSKREYGPPLGIDKITEICNSCNQMPIVAVGGISTDNFKELFDAGVSGVAGIRMFNDPNTIEQTIKTFFEFFAP